MTADSPEGPFIPLTDGIVTPPDWNCIDGTLYWEDEIPYLVFSHSFEDDPKGYICYMQMSADLKEAAGKPVVMISAWQMEPF